MKKLIDYFDDVNDYTNSFPKDYDGRKATKYKANLFGQGMRNYIQDILDEEKSGLYVSLNNSFIIGNPIEYDLLIVKKLNKKNLYDIKDVVCSIELKCGGYIGDVDNLFKRYNESEKYKQNKYKIKHLYISSFDTEKKQKELKRFESIFIWDDPCNEKRIVEYDHKTYIGDDKFIKTLDKIDRYSDFKNWVINNIIK